MSKAQQVSYRKDCTTLKILVTGIGGGGHGEQILKALSTLKPEKYELFGADANPNILKNEFTGKVYRLPFATSPNYIDSLINLCQKIGINAVFHGSEPELLALAQNRKRFEEIGIFLPINNTNLIEQALNKAEISQELSNKGFQVPAWWLMNHQQDLAYVDRYPVVVKPHLGGGGSRDVFIAQNLKELEAIAVLLKFPDLEKNLFVQEYVGRADEEYTVGVLNQPDGNLLGSIALRRDLSSTLSVKSRTVNISGDNRFGEFLIISSGISQGTIDIYPEVRSQCEVIASELKSTGPLNIQCRFVDGKVIIFEVNPRFSGTTSCRALAGFNEPDLLLDSYFSKEKRKFISEFKRGVFSRSLVEHFESL